MIITDSRVAQLLAWAGAVRFRSPACGWQRGPSDGTWGAAAVLSVRLLPLQDTVMTPGSLLKGLGTPPPAPSLGRLAHLSLPTW